MAWHAPALLLPLLMLSSSVTAASQQEDTDNPCCPGDNVFLAEPSVCLQNNLRPELNCSQGLFIMDPVHEPHDAFNITDDGTLINHELGLMAPNERHCLTHSQDPSGYTSEKLVALVCFADDEETSVTEAGSSHFRMYAICLLVSVVFLLATLLVYLVLPQLRDLQGKTVMCVVASLCMGEVWIAVAQLHESGFSDMSFCVAIAFFMYFWMMSAIFWMNVVSFNLWRSVIFPDPHADEGRLFTYYSLYGWGAPLVFLIAGLITQHVPGEHIKPEFGRSKCWFHDSKETWSYFYGPMAVLMTCNIVFFVWTSWRLWKDYRNTSMPKLRAMRFKCLLYLKLFVIMGISWIFELLSFVFDGNSGFWIALDIVNALHGIFIFVVVVLRKRVLQALAQSRRFGLQWPKSWAAGVDEESETMLAEEVQLSNNTNN